MLPSISSHVYSFERSPFNHQLDQLSPLTNQITFATPLFIVAAAVRPSLIPIICPPICISIKSIFFHRRIEFLINSLSPANGAITYHISHHGFFSLTSIPDGTHPQLARDASRARALPRPPPELCLAPPQIFFPVHAPG